MNRNRALIGTPEQCPNLTCSIYPLNYEKGVARHVRLTIVASRGATRKTRHSQPRNLSSIYITTTGSNPMSVF
jgi:hypothetical protein